MKQVFTINPLLLLILVTQFHASKPEVVTNVYARTGSRGIDCSGSGICTIEESDEEIPPTSSYRAIIGFDTEGRIFLEFKYADIPSHVAAAQFSTDVFDMQSDCPVPSNVLQSIHAEATELTLKSGFYPMVKTGQSVRITFN